MIELLVGFGFKGDDRFHFTFEVILRAPGTNMIKVFSGEDTLSRLLENEIALILINVQMPGMDGYETAVLIRGNSDN